MKTLISQGFLPFSKWHLFCQHVSKQKRYASRTVFVLVMLPRKRTTRCEALPVHLAPELTAGNFDEENDLCEFLSIGTLHFDPIMLHLKNDHISD